MGDGVGNVLITIVLTFIWGNYWVHNLMLPSDLRLCPTHVYVYVSLRTLVCVRMYVYVEVRRHVSSHVFLIMFLQMPHVFVHIVTKVYFVEMKALCNFK